MPTWLLIVLAVSFLVAFGGALFSLLEGLVRFVVDLALLVLEPVVAVLLALTLLVRRARRVLA